MAVVEADHELLEDPPGLLLREAPGWLVGQGVGEEVAPPGILHGNGEVAGRQEDLLQGHYERVPQAALVLDFPGDVAPIELALSGPHRALHFTHRVRESLPEAEGVTPASKKLCRAVVLLDVHADSTALQVWM